MDHLTQEARSQNMRKIKSKNTSPEILVRRALFSSGLRYRIHNKKLPGKPDISVFKYKLIIEVKGCFWHRHKGCKYNTTPKSNTDYWLNKIDSNVKRDKRNKLNQEKMGFKIFDIWECETKDKDLLSIIINSIQKYISLQK